MDGVQEVSSCVPPSLLFPHPSFTAFFALDFLKQLRRQAIERLRISLQKIAYCRLTIGFPYWDPWIAD